MVIRIYDYLHKHVMMRWIMMTMCMLAVTLSVFRLSYKEDISDFLPVGTSDRTNLAIYQDISGASKVIAIFDNPDDADLTVQAIDCFCEQVASTDTIGIASQIVAKFDWEQLENITSFIYENIPYFLTDKDYQRIDSLLSQPQYISEQIKADHELLLLPSGGLLSENISRDPLNIFTPVVSRIGQSQDQSRFESYNGYIFSPDMKKAIVLIPSPFGNSETKNNAKLLSLLEQAVSRTEKSFPSISIHLTGGPQIAVGNASQIRKDSILAITIAIVFIVLLLTYSFRSFRNIILIAISILWGWLFALGSISFIHSDISLIVIGISSVIIGIAVNYPLHLIDHISHGRNIRGSLREIVTPLLIGNVTTIGAFLTLVPLKSVALRDLGLFASLLLLGTILFVLVFLPHLVKEGNMLHHKTLFPKLVNAKLESKSWLIYVVVIATIVFSFFNLQTEFDANMSNINYMTDEQKKDLNYFQSMFDDAQSDSMETLYIVSSEKNMDEALSQSMQKQHKIDSLVCHGIVTNRKSPQPFITSKGEQQKRLGLWRELTEKYRNTFDEDLTRQAEANGFSKEAFDAFRKIITTPYYPKEFDAFSPITQTVYVGNFSIDPSEQRYSVIEMVTAKKGHIAELRESFKNSFSVESMNSAFAKRLSDDFNYIGIACSLIVFLFLWFSFGRIELAIISFLPMAISWIWILGLMAILDIKFNIVNVILATFIFGQGDDYTIFITEGCQHEYAYRKPMLASFKNSIVLSALIMFVGIGSLVVAKHPALLSLAQVTIIGMFSVVLTAWLIPPLLFGWITKSKGRYRKRPLTLGALLRTWISGTWWIGQLSIGYIIGAVLFTFGGRRPSTRKVFHRIVTRAHRLDLRLLPGVKNIISNPHGEDFKKPCVIVCNHQSLLDPMYLMALSPRIIIVANQRSSMNPVIRKMFKWLDFYTITEDAFEQDIPIFESYIKEGYSIAIYAEGERNPESSILRFHKGAFMLAQQLNIDILPIMLHGVNNVMPIKSFAANSGTINVLIGKRISPDSPMWDKEYSKTTKNVHKYFMQHYEYFKDENEKAEYFVQLVKERYMYKGTSIYSDVKKALSESNIQWINNIAKNERIIIVKNCGSGALALLAALVCRKSQIYACEENEEVRILAKNSSRGLVKNLSIVSPEELKTLNI